MAKVKNSEKNCASAILSTKMHTELWSETSGQLVIWKTKEKCKDYYTGP
jgi:hypothetical protein